MQGGRQGEGDGNHQLGRRMRKAEQAGCLRARDEVPRMDPPEDRR